MPYTRWDAVKDFLGAVGPILIAVPWFRDFQLRNQKSQVEGVPTEGRLHQIRSLIEDSIRKKIESPKMADFVWTIVGLALIFTSFLIALIRGMGDLLGGS